MEDYAERPYPGIQIALEINAPAVSSQLPRNLPLRHPRDTFSDDGQRLSFANPHHYGSSRDSTRDQSTIWVPFAAIGCSCFMRLTYSQVFDFDSLLVGVLLRVI